MRCDTFRSTIDVRIVSVSLPARRLPAMQARYMAGITGTAVDALGGRREFSSSTPDLRKSKSVARRGGARVIDLPVEVRDAGVH
jgi:hypothetical protein